MWIALLLSASPASAELTAAAAASARPVECRSTGEGASSLWEAARQPALTSHCRWLARGYALLRRDPARSLLAADRAESALPGRAGANVLAGRALVALGRPKDAHQRFLLALKHDSSALESPEALHAHASSALQAGATTVATDAYRALVPRVGLLPSPVLRQRAYLEAALLLMHQDALAEATGALTEARRRDRVPGLGQLVAAALSLALDRQGRREEAQGVLAEVASATGLWELAEAPAAHSNIAPVTLDGELWAVVGHVASVSNPELAREAWTKYLDSPAGKNPKLRAHAEARQRELALPRRGR